ncbi:putative transposable element, partial [Pseudoloma neurophilia]
VDEYDDIWLIYQNLRYYCIKKFWSIFQTKWYSVELEFSKRCCKGCFVSILFAISI